MTKYEDFVQHTYLMNSATEFFIPSGEGLKNGMVVLLAEPQDRVEIWRWSKEKVVDDAAALMRNRWCVISEVRISEGHVWFIGDYGDNEKSLRTYPINKGWLVKLDHAKKLFGLEMMEKRVKVREIVLSTRYGNDIDEATDRIMRLFDE